MVYKLDFLLRGSSFSLRASYRFCKITKVSLHVIWPACVARDEVSFGDPAAVHFFRPVHRLLLAGADSMSHDATE